MTGQTAEQLLLRPILIWSLQLWQRPVWFVFLPSQIRVFLGCFLLYPPFLPLNLQSDPGKKKSELFQPGPSRLHHPHFIHPARGTVVRFFSAEVKSKQLKCWSVWGWRSWWRSQSWFSEQRGQRGWIRQQHDSGLKKKSEILKYSTSL